MQIAITKVVAKLLIYSSMSASKATIYTHVFGRVVLLLLMKISFKIILKIKKFIFVAFIFIMLAHCNNIYANKTDSLKIALKSNVVPDSTRVNILIAISDIFQDVSLDTMILYLQKAKYLADNVHYEYGRGQSRHRLGLAYLFKNETDSSLKYYESALNIYIDNNIVRPQGNANLSIADIYLKKRDHPKAIEYYNKGINICEQMQNYIGKGFGLMSLGGVYVEMANYTEAVNYYLQSLTPFLKEKYYAGYCMSLTNIATVYSNMNNFPKAIEYINKSEAVNLQNASIEQRIFISYNLGSVYNAMKDYTKGLNIFKKALILSDSLDDDSWRCSNLVSMADMYFGLGYYDSAYKCYNEALLKNAKINDPSVLISGKSGIGRILIKQGRMADGLLQMEEAFDYAYKNKLKQQIFETAFILSTLYDSSGKYGPALKYHKIYANYKDSVHNDKNTIKIQQLQFDYEIALKEEQIVLLNKNKEVAIGHTQKQLVVLRILGISIAGLAIISIFLYRSRRQEQKSKNKIERQKDELRLITEKLTELNDFKDITFSVLSHDLRGPIHSFSAAMSMLEQQLITEAEFNEMKTALGGQTKSLIVLLDDLLNWARIYMKGQVSANKSNVNLLVLLNKSIDALNDTAKAKNIDILNSVDLDTMVWCDAEQINIVIRNILSNAIKFSFRGSQIIISANSTNESVQLIIADTGVGMTKQAVDDLFLWTNKASSFGTEGERGIGLGMKLCLEFIKTNNATLDVKSELNKGTVVSVLLTKARDL